jgi:outer membrane protein assembly factor BamA
VVRCLVFVFAGLVAFSTPSGATTLPGVSSPVPVAADTTTPPIVRSVAVKGNEFFSDAELKRRIRTEPNREILSLPGVTWWRWIYQLGDSGLLGKRVGRALKASGEPPAYLDSTAISDDVERLRLFYEQQGFREAAVAVTVRDTETPDRVRVVFFVEPGPPTYVRRVTYEGLDRLTDDQKRRLVDEATIEPGDAYENALDEDALDEDASDEGASPNLLSYPTDGQRYQKPALLEERGRLLTFLRNEGYAAVTRDSIRAIIYEPSPDSFDVTFRVRPGRQYRFGDVFFGVTGTEPEAGIRTDTLQVSSEEHGGYRPPVVVRVEGDGRLGTSVLRRALQFEPGATYDRSKVLATKRRLEGTGVFAFTNISPQLRDTVRVDSVAEPYLPVRIEARTRRRHRVRAETFVLQRDPTGGDPSTTAIQNEFGVGVGVTYENVNAFGGGETFRVSTSGSVATGLDSTIVTSAQFEATTSLTLPYLIRPFDRLERVFDLINARTRLSLSFLTARRNDLGLLIRGRGSARLRLEMEHTPTLVSLVDVLDLSLSNPDALPQFEERFLRRVFGDPQGGGITDPVQRTQILEDYTQPQINTALRYTLRSATVNPLRRDRGHLYEASAEIGNLIPLALDRFVFSPGTLEYSLPGLFGTSDADTTSVGGMPGADTTATAVQGGRLIYRPYLRATVDLRRYHPLSRGTTLAYKAFAGVAFPIARPNRVPFDRRFFSGGATSVRGWELRALGPGGAALAVNETGRAISDDVANILGGDVKLETSVELRTTVLRNILGGNWMLASYVDAGNVWFGPRNPGLSTDNDVREGPDGTFRVPDFLTEIGVGSGLGLRIVWEYLVVRLDYAYKLHDPSPANDDVFNRGFGDSRARVLHFGIGHAF